MKQLAILFLVLASAFGGIWVTKMNAPTNRPNSYANGIEGNYWWNAVEDTQEVNTNWKLSSGVPDNYVPVPGKPGLYMIVDEDGYIIGYKKGTKGENGEWIWEDTDPNIPENYEAVPGLDNVYKVTYDDGTVKYFKYVRNKDDTYAFVEVDAKGNMIGEVQPKGNETPDNYERVNRNQYAVKNKDGVTIGYKERKTDPTSETGYTWVNIEEPDTKTAVELPGFDLTQDATGTGDITGGVRPYAGYSSSGSVLDLPTVMPSQETTQVVTGDNQSGMFVFTQPETQTIITEQYFITAPPGMTGQQVIIQTGDGGSGLTAPSVPTMSPMGDEQFFDPGDMSVGGGNGNQITQQNTGTYEQKEYNYSTVTEGNYQVTYRQEITTVYNLNGEIIAGPNKGNKEEVSRVQINNPAASASAISSNLKDETDRISNLLFDSNGKYNSNVPNQMLELLNKERINNGKLAVDADGGNAYKIALCRAAMMALTGSNNKSLPSYGTLSEMCAKYGVSGSSPSENMLIINSTSADSIHNTLQSAAANVRLNEEYSKVAIAIAVKDGVFYIDEVFIK